MVNLLKLILGDGKSLITEVMVLSFIVALAVGARALTNVVKDLTHVGIPPTWDYFVRVVYVELSTITHVWLLTMWVLVVVTTYLVSNYVLRNVVITYTTLAYLGASKSLILRLLVIRYSLVALMTWLVGWSVGLTASQIVFRFTAYVLNTPYEVPYLSLGELIELATTVCPLVILGSVSAMVRVIRCRY